MLCVVESAVDLIVPELAPLIDRWRRPMVEVAALGVPPHVTLLYPWAPAPISPRVADLLAQTLQGVSPIRLCFASLERFESGVLFLSLDAASEDGVKEVARRVAQAFPEHPPYGGLFADPRPHVTVAKGSLGQLSIVEREVNEVIDLPIVLVVDRVTVSEEQPDGTWLPTHYVPLANQ